MCSKLLFQVEYFSDKSSLYSDGTERPPQDASEQDARQDYGNQGQGLLLRQVYLQEHIPLVN